MSVAAILLLLALGEEATAPPRLSIPSYEISPETAILPVPLVLENVTGPFECHWFGGVGLDGRILELLELEPNPDVGVPPPGGQLVIPFGPPQDQLWISYLRAFDFGGGMYVPDESHRVVLCTLHFRVLEPRDTVLAWVARSPPNPDPPPGFLQTSIFYRGAWWFFDGEAASRLGSGTVHFVESFLRGDIDGDGLVTPTDPVFLLNYLFRGGPEPRCLDAADGNDDGELNLSDAVYLLRHLHASGPAPPAPSSEPGVDPTADQLICPAQETVPNARAAAR